LVFGLLLLRMRHESTAAQHLLGDPMQLSAATKINDLLATHPFLQDFLVSYNAHFQLLRNSVARATVGRLATLGTAARMAGVEVDALLRDIAAVVEKETAKCPQVVEGGGALSRDERIAMLGHIIAELHDGGDVATARQHFAQAVGDVDAGEIAAMEEEMIRGGLPVGEVQRLCDVHVGAFRGALDEKATPAVPAGHPVHTYLADNAIIGTVAQTLGDAGRTLPNGDGAEALASARAALDRFGGVDNHFLRKEHQLFPLLERHAVTGPSQVMWGIHDQIRAQWKNSRRLAEVGDRAALAEELPKLARALVEMIYKEEKILFPMALEKLSAEEWAEVKRGEDELGYGFAKPAVALPLLNGRPAPVMAAPAAAPAATGMLNLGTGALSLEVVDLMLRHLPIDISFVDENDVVRYYSDSKERIFPRSPAAIGRNVKNCHPPKSVATVNRILDSFRAGTQNVAEFWIEMGGKFIHIRYFAVRDSAGSYRGCLEVTQDVGAIRALTGQRRLLDWTD
jgi:DUF438 domain-containing protein